MKKLLLLLIIAIFCASCSLTIKNMVPTNKNLIFSPSGKTISVTVESKLDEKYIITAEDFRKALASSIRRSELFSLVTTDKESDYKLNAEITDCVWSADGLSWITDFKIRYKIIKNGENDIFYEEQIESSYTATVSEAFAGGTRRMRSIEGSIKKNLQKFIWNISKLEIN